MTEGQERPAIALLGCGEWGLAHARAWQELGCLRVVCDPDPERLAAARERCPGAEAEADPRAVTRRPDVRAVVVAAPPAARATLASQALAAGKDVLVASPMAASSAEGEQLAAEALQLGRVLMVARPLDRHPALLRLAELVRAGELGRLRYLYARHLRAGRGHAAERSPSCLAAQDLAALLRLAGSAPEAVACQGATEPDGRIADLLLATLRFPGGLAGHVLAGGLHPEPEHCLVAVGERATAVLDDGAPWERKLVLGSGPGGAAVAVPLAAADLERALCEAFLQHVATREPDGEVARELEVLHLLEAAARAPQPPDQPQPPPAASEGGGFFAHATAVVEPGAVVGEGTRIWHFSHVMPGARIGRGCNLGQNVYVGRGVRIGDGVKIQNNVSVYEAVELEDHVFCGPSAVFTNVLEPRSEIERKDEFRRTLVRRGASLGANCTIVCGVTIGTYAFVGAGAVVTRDVPDYALVVGTPARFADWVCRCGARLRRPDLAAGERADCPACGRGYRLAAPGRLEPAP